MSYNVDIADGEKAYWDALPLSSEAKDRIKQFIADVSEDFRRAPVNRPKADAPYFKIEYVIWDSWGDRRLHRLDFHIRDDKAQIGVLFIAYIEHS